jgi:hypothetical protein
MTASKGNQTMNSLPLRRIRIAVLPVLLCCAGMTVLAAPAEAVVISGAGGGSVSVNGSGSDCLFTSSPSSASTPPLTLTDTQSVPFSIAVNGTGASTVNASDVTSVAASLQGTASGVVAGGSTQSFGVSGVVSLGEDSAFGLASDCSTSASANFSLSSVLTLTAPAMLELRAKVSGVSPLSTLTATFSTPGGGSVQMANATGSDSRRLVLVPAGVYGVSISLTSALASALPIATPKNLVSHFSLQADFRQPGLAEGSSAGTGAKYLALPDTLNCSNGTATADFTAKAGKKVKKPKKGHKKKKPVITKADFFAGDAKVASVRKPNRDTLTTVTGIDTSGEVTLEAVLTVPKKGTLSVRRTYLPCS